MHYEALKFVEAIREKYWLGMLAAIDAALINAARGQPKRRNDPIYPGGDVEFMRFLIAARVYLLGEGESRPAGLEDVQFLMLRPLCEHLVKQGRFAEKTLRLFANIQPWAAAYRPPEDDITERKGRRT